MGGYVEFGNDKKVEAINVGRKSLWELKRQQAFPAHVLILCWKRQHALRLAGLIPTMFFNVGEAFTAIILKPTYTKLKLIKPIRRCDVH